ncbi:HD domain-containing protein [Patescibacteria group bacterium]|nr:HD domain-containing protein [Patescibacteria group bacterium]MCG2695148.1 HD domain-containing protein [Candidatus Parcubacteria bacterium]
MKIIELPNIINFVQLLNKFRDIERVIHSNGGDRWENDVEHSYQLTMLAWYIISSNNLDLDIDLVIKYALIHDLVEIYAGDTYIYSEDKELKESKKERESLSLTRLEMEFSEFPEIFELIKQYERRESRESKFVYALDKIEPVLNIYTNGGRTWREKNVTIEMLIKNKKEKVAEDSKMEKLFDDLIDLLRREEETLF